MSREGRDLRIGWVDDWREIRQVMSEVMLVHRARDLELRGMSLLDEPAQAAFYEQVLVRHAGEWRLLAVRIDGRLAGYAMCLVDGATLRVWDNRVAPEFRRYSAGLVANAEVVLSAARERSIHEVDWGCGIQRYKTSMSTRVVEGRNLVAWSSTLLRAGRGLARRIPRPSGPARGV